MMPQAEHALRVAIPADDLCLSYVNTRYWRGTAEPTEDLHGMADVTRWLAGAAPASAGLAEAVAAQFQADPAVGTAAFSEAIGLREMLHGTLAGLADGGVPDLAGLNAALQRAAPRNKLVCDDGSYGWEAATAPASATWLLSGVLWSAADLLAGPRRGLLRACANPKCRWLFLDNSKSGNRRWCMMSACGNRAKAHRHYLKAKAARS